MKEKSNMMFVVLVLLAFALTRWPGVMPQNFSAAYGLIFCAGVFHKRIPWWSVALVLLLTDVLKNVFYYQTDAFNDYMLANYGAYLGLFLLGRLFSPKNSLPKLVGGGLLGAVLFYLITNTAAWMQNPEYVKNIAGWIQALTVGTSGWPETWKFFSNTLLSGGLFTGFLAAAFRMQQPVESESEEEAEAPQAEPEASAEESPAK